MYYIYSKLFYLLLVICLVKTHFNERKKGRNNNLIQQQNSQRIFLWKFYVIPQNYMLSKKGTILGIYLRHCYNDNKMNNFSILLNNNSFYDHNDGFHSIICKISNYRCLYFPHQSHFKVPYNVAINLKKIEVVNAITNKRVIFDLDTTASKSKPFDGITVCTPLLYYYNNWLQMFMFLEKWRKETKARIFIYYKTISNDVYTLLKYYQKLGLVYLIPSPIFPHYDQLQKATPTSFGMGPIFFNDCMYRNNSNYIATMDVDEYFHIFDKQNKSYGILQFIKDNIQLYPTTYFFNFKSYYISYINKNINESFEFATKGLLTEDKLNKGGKSILLTNKIDYPCYHMPLFKKIVDGYRFPESKAILLHARPNFIFKNVKSTDEVRSLKEFERLKLISNYQTLIKEVNKTLIFIYKSGIINNLERCMKRKLRKDKKLCYYNIELCKEEMNILENWTYTSKEKENYVDYVKF